MNQNAFDEGKAAYQRRDWLSAVNQLEKVKEEGELCGEADHLLGNAYMQLSEYSSAASAYADALADNAYGKVGAISCNMGRALLVAGRPSDAVGSLLQATQDPEYKTAYKAYLALGSAYEQLGDIRNAGIAYRNAAIDDTNPNPSDALTNLGSCFMRLGRPIDAVEAYRTALDFAQDQRQSNLVYRDLGLAYVAANRMAEAVDAFDHATSDGSLQLSGESQAAFDAARKAVSAVTGRKASDTDALLAATGYGSGSFDPLDPTGSTGELMPSPEDTGFFEVSEDDLVAQDKRLRRNRHGCLKAFLTLIILGLLAAGALYFAYTQGYGWPTQESIVKDMFYAHSQGEDIQGYLSDDVSAALRTQIEDILPKGATIKITGIDQNATSSVAFASASLLGGGTQDYTIKLVRDGIGWKVSNVETTFVSQAGQEPTISTTGTVDVTSEAEQDTSSEEAEQTSTDDSSQDTSDATEQEGQEESSEG